MTESKQHTSDQDQRICPGCGATLQTEDPNQIGYVPSLVSDTDASVICQRCYKLKHYNNIASITLDQEEFNRILHQIGSKQGLIVHIVDIFDFEGSLINGLNRYGNNNPIMLAVNKVDLLPAGFSHGKLEQWVRRRLKQFGLRVVDVVLISAVKGIGFDRLVEAMDRWHRGQNIYMVGAANVGKSSVINRLIRDYSSLDQELTTSRYPGTTLDLVHIPLADGQAIVDTPGLMLGDRYTTCVPVDMLKTLLPQKTIKPKIYQLNEKQTLFFGGLARFDFVKGNRQPFVCYLSNSIQIHRTKLASADALYEKHKGKMLSPPREEQLDTLPSFTVHTFRIKKEEPSDLFIYGLGWIKITGKEGAIVDVHVPKGIKVAIREAMI